MTWSSWRMIRTATRRPPHGSSGSLTPCELFWAATELLFRVWGGSELFGSVHSKNVRTMTLLTLLPLFQILSSPQDFFKCNVVNLNKNSVRIATAYPSTRGWSSPGKSCFPCLWMQQTVATVFRKIWRGFPKFLIFRKFKSRIARGLHQNRAIKVERRLRRSK